MFFSYGIGIDPVSGKKVVQQQQVNPEIGLTLLDGDDEEMEQNTSNQVIL